MWAAGGVAIYTLRRPVLWISCSALRAAWTSGWRARVRPSVSGLASQTIAALSRGWSLMQSSMR